jgi:integrase
MKTKPTTKTAEPTVEEIQRTVLGGGTCEYQGARIALRTYSTADGDKAGFQSTIPAKITGSGRKRKLFKTAADAASWIEDFYKSRAESSATAAEAANFANELPRLRRLGITVTAALDHYEATFIARETRKRLSEIQAHLLEEIELSAEELAADGAADIALRPRSLESIKAHGRRVIADFEDCFADQIDADRAMDWIKTARNLNGDLWSRKSRSHHWAHLNRLLNHAVTLGATKGNPLQGISPERRKTFLKLTTARPEILTIEQAENLLRTAAESERKLLPCVALGLFAGLRSNEILRLKWGAIDYDNKESEDGKRLPAPIVVIDEQVAKTRQQRHVTITPALAAWLALVDHGDDDLKIWQHTDKSYERAMRRLARKAGIENWPHNGLRHTFASCLCAMQGVDYARTQLGHSAGEQDTIFKHYRRLLKPAEAERLFAIRPEGKGKKLLKFAAAV